LTLFVSEGCVIHAYVEPSGSGGTAWERYKGADAKTRGGILDTVNKSITSDISNTYIIL